MKPADVVRGFSEDPKWVDKSKDESYVLAVFVKTAHKVRIKDDGLLEADKTQYAVGFDLVGPLASSEIEAAKLFVVNLLDREVPHVRYSVHSFSGRPLAPNLLINPTLQDWDASVRRRFIEPRI